MKKLEEMYLKHDMIYVINHSAYIDPVKSCFIIKTKINSEDLTKILASICFKFEDIIDDTVFVENEHILYLLKKYYNVIDVKDQFKSYLPYFNFNNADTTNCCYFEKENLVLRNIDLYYAREKNCGPNYKDLMIEYLPQDDKFESYILGLKNYYLNQDNSNN